MAALRSIPLKYSKSVRSAKWTVNDRLKRTGSNLEQTKVGANRRDVCAVRLPENDLASASRSDHNPPILMTDWIASSKQASPARLS